MTSQIPTRRVTRSSRLRDENENLLKGLPPTIRGAVGVAPGVATSSKPTTALDPNTQNKRKREALTEVTNNKQSKHLRRGLSTDGKAVKPQVVITRPLRSVTQAPMKVRSSVVAAAAADTADRAAKRRHTSSEAGEAPEAEVEVAAPTPSHDSPTADQEPIPQVEGGEEGEMTGWDDLDKDDFDDPTMVSEYVLEIFKYLSECEEQSLPNPSYIRHQADLRWPHRAILMDHLIGLHSRFRLMPETLYLAVNLIDRFLSMRVVSLIKLQLVGLASLFIAAKFEEIVAPSAQHFLAAASMEDQVKEEEMLKAERYILKTLNWTVSLYPQPLNWLRRISKADDYDPLVRTVAKFFLEIHVVERRLLGVKPSLLAAASIWLARLVLDSTEWTPNLAHYSGYSEKNIIPVANVMINYCLREDPHEHFQKKYASRKFNKTSVFVKDWVTTRWNIGDKVSLEDELPFIKALAIEIKMQSLP